MCVVTAPFDPPCDPSTRGHNRWRGVWGLVCIVFVACDAAPTVQTTDTTSETVTAGDSDTGFETDHPGDTLGDVDIEPDDTLHDTLEDADTSERDTLEDTHADADTIERDTLEDTHADADTSERDTLEDTHADTLHDALEDTDTDTSEQDTLEDTGEPSDVIPDTSPCASPCVTGRIRFEQRRPNPNGTALGALQLVPLAHHPVGLAGTDLHTVTDADGRFTLPLPAQPDCTITFAAMVPRDTNAPFDTPALAVLHGSTNTLPTTQSAAVPLEHLWAWSYPCEDQLELTVRLSNGSGALAALQTASHVLTAFEAHFGPAHLDLALVWHPSRTWSCGSCYLDGRFQGVTHTTSGTHFPRAIFLSGNNANPHHFNPSIIAHELGHFALELWSASPLIGGTHGFDRRVDPVLAWSEGAATLLGQWALIGTTDAPQRFFAIQQNVQYWVDLEAIGRSPTSDDSNLNLLVPLPLPDGPLDQPLSEGVVAAVLWDLFDGLDDDPLALGDALISLFAAPRLADVRTGLDRAATGPDLVDLLDALRCDASLHEAVGGTPAGTPLPAPLTSVLLGFPYDDAPLCLP